MSLRNNNLLQLNKLIRITKDPPPEVTNPTIS